MRLLRYVLLWFCLVMIRPEAGPAAQAFSVSAEIAVSQGDPLQWPGRLHVALLPVSESVSQKIESRRPDPQHARHAFHGFPGATTALTETLFQQLPGASGRPALYLLYHHFLFYDPVVS